MNYIVQKLSKDIYVTQEGPSIRREINLSEDERNIIKNIKEDIDLRRKHSQALWKEFRIPKKSGGMRTINAPEEVLKRKQRQLLDCLYKLEIPNSEHSYAFIKNTSVMDAILKHQRNESKYYLKVDIKDFFGSITLELIEESLSKIYPTTQLSSKDTDLILRTIESVAFENGKLPQGGVTSPFLSNWVMIPFLYKINKLINYNLTEFSEIGQNYILTCYADDITISAKNNFNWREMVDKIKLILNPYFQLKEEKTRYGSRAGRNHILGKKINKDNNITAGYKKVKEWKNTLLQICNQINGSEPKAPWEERISIYNKLMWDFNTNPGYLNYLITRYQNKYTSNGNIKEFLTQPN